MAIIKNKFAGKIEAGKNNTSSGDYSSAIAGQNNCATGVYSVVAGGCGNTVAYRSLSSIDIDTDLGGSAIIGGINNCSTLNMSFIAGGCNNFIYRQFSADTGEGAIIASRNSTVYRYGYIIGGNTATVYRGGVILGGSGYASDGGISGLNGCAIGGIAHGSATANGTGLAIGTSVVSCTNGISIGRNVTSAACSVGIGGFNSVTGQYSVGLGGGFGAGNIVPGISSSVSGGSRNCVNDNFSSIAGGCNNKVFSQESFIGSGFSNCTSGLASSVLGGQLNCATGIYSSLVGGCGNQATGYGSFVGGGLGNCSTNPNSFIGSGFCNRIISSATQGMVIGGGCCNVLSPNDQNQYPMVIAGGQCNCIGGAGGVISGGTLNVGGTYNINHTTIGGGVNNTASVHCSTIIGGSCNSASSTFSTVLGGSQNIASDTYSIAGGFYNRASSRSSIALGCGGCTSFPGQFAVGAENHIYGLSYAAGLFQFSDLMAFNKAMATVETYFTTGQEVLLYPGDNSSNLLKPSTNKVWHVTAKYSMYVGDKSGTVDGINIGDTLFGTTEFGYRNGTNGFITSSIRDNKVTNNEALNTGSFVFTYGPSQEIVTKMIIPEFTGGGSLKVRGTVKFELVETIQG